MMTSARVSGIVRSGYMEFEEEAIGVKSFQEKPVWKWRS